MRRPNKFMLRLENFFLLEIFYLSSRKKFPPPTRSMKKQSYLTIHGADGGHILRGNILRGISEDLESLPCHRKYFFA